MNYPAIVAAFGLGLSGTALADGTSGIMQRVVKAPENPKVASPTWDVLRQDVTDTTEFLDGARLIFFQAPEAAFDAAFVPFSICQRRNTGERLTKITVVVDDNPAPLLATFELSPLMGELYLESRVRYDQPSNIRVIAKTDKNNTYMTGRFV